MKNSYPALVTLIVVALQVTGCIRKGSGVGVLRFSPDAKHVCYIREDRIEENVVDGKTWLRSRSLHWCSTSDPAKEYSTHIDTLGAEYRSYSTVLGEVKWSPNGTRIAVLTPHKLAIVETNSGKKRELRDGTITSFVWLPDGQIVYCTRRIKGNMQRRVICREDLDIRQRTDIVAFPERHADGSPGRGDNWSPSGKFVIFMEPDFGGQYHCVNALDGTAFSFGQVAASDYGVAWTPDSSRAFCVSRKIGPEDVYEAILVDPATGTTVDCTGGFQATFAGHFPSLVPLWTVDGKYVIVNALHINGHLVHPDPWQVVSLGQILAPHFTAPTKWSTINPWLFRLPVSGWVGVVPTGNYGDSPTQYAADYSGQRVMPLLKDFPRAVSPDGTKAATIGKDGHVKIHRLGKWWLPSDEPLILPPSERSPGGRGQEGHVGASRCIAETIRAPRKRQHHPALRSWFTANASRPEFNGKRAPQARRLLGLAGRSKFGRARFRQGVYFYVGTAQRNLSARLGRHSRKEKTLRWHIDYLSVRAEMLGPILIRGPRRRRHIQPAPWPSVRLRRIDPINPGAPGRIAGAYSPRACACGSDSPGAPGLDRKPPT